MPDPSSQTLPAQGMPIPFLTAAWSGMDYDAIVAGLKSGSILPPLGAEPGWLPQAGTVGVAYSPAAVSTLSAVTDGTQATPAHGRDDVARWFTKLDPALSEAGFDAIWQRAGGTDALRAQSLTSLLARTLLGAPASGTDQAAAGTAVGAALDAFLADPAHRAHVVDLATMSGADMAAQAASDVGLRYALSQMDSVALTGNRSLFAMSNADGALDRFDRDTGESLVSDAWLEDRGKFLAWKLAHEQGNELAVSGTEDWTFVDRAASDADGAPVSLQLRTGASNAGQNQVVFGTDDSDVMKGVHGSDRMYGGAGDDVLLGGAGGDHLEGGGGADVVMGGAGNDELIGNQGDDELDGGAGIDVLQAGSGNDALTGGRGNDRLEGGLGNDTYAIESGDGNDTIVDSDGLGAIELDGHAVGGTMSSRNGGGWASADGRIDFTFDGDAAEGGTLTLRAFGAGADHTGAPDNVIRIKDWKNGDLGITLSGDLGDADAGATATSSAISASTVSGSAGEQGAPSGVEFAGEGLIATSNGQSPGSDPASAMAPDEPVPGGAAGTPAADAAWDAGAGPALADFGATSAASSPATASAPSSEAADAFDFDAAMASIFATDGAPTTTLDPAALQRGIDAFSGVLAPPDITHSASSATFAADGITTGHLADALAGDTGGEDFHAEAAMAPSFDPVDMRAPDALAARIDKSAARNGVAYASS